jgi:hypothetical protein
MWVRGPGRVIRAFSFWVPKEIPIRLIRLGEVYLKLVSIYVFGSGIYHAPWLDDARIYELS